MTPLGFVEVKYGEHVPVCLYNWLSNAKFAMLRRTGRKWIFAIDGDEFMKMFGKRNPSRVTVQKKQQDDSCVVTPPN